MDFTSMKRRDLQALCKRHGLPAGGTNAALVSRLTDAAIVSGDAGADNEVVARKGCLKRSAGGSDLGETKKVSFVLEESRGRRRRSQATCSPAVVAKTRGRNKAAAETRSVISSDAEGGRRGLGQQMRAEAFDGSAHEDSVAAEAGAVVPVRRSRRISMGLGDVEAAEVGKTVAVGRKRKQRSKEKEEETVISAQFGVLCKVTRRSSLSGAALPSPLPIENKRRGRKATDAKNEVDAKAQELVVAGSSAVVESKRSGWKRDDEPVVQNAEVEATGKITRSRSVAATVTAPIVLENKRRRTTKHDQPEGVVPTVLEKHRNDADATRTLRNSFVQVNNGAVDGTHLGQELQDRRQPSSPSTHRNQLLASSMEEEDQDQAAPSKRPPLRRSRRKSCEPSIADSKTNESDSLPMEASNAKGEDAETQQAAKEPVKQQAAKEPVKQQAAKEPVKRVTCKSAVSAVLEKEAKDLVAGNGPELEAHATVLKRKSVAPVKKIQNVSQEFQNAQGDDVVKLLALNGPTRLSTRKSVISAMLDEEDKDLVAEKGPEPEAHVRRLKRKSVVLVKNVQDVYEDFQKVKGDNLMKQPTVKEPARRSTRKSVVSAKIQEEDKDLVPEKVRKPEACVTISKRKSIALIKTIQDVSEDFQNAKGDEVVQQPVVKETARQSTRKSVVSAMLQEEVKSLIAERNPEAHVRRSKRKSVLPVKDCKGDDNETQNAMDKDVDKQLPFTEPVRRSTRKSVISSVLEGEDKNLITEKSPEAHVRTLKRKSVVPVKDSKSEETLNAKGDDVVKQPTVKEPARRSTRKSVVSAMLEEGNKTLVAEKSVEAHFRGLKRNHVVPVEDCTGDYEETQSVKDNDLAKEPTVTQPIRRSTHKSVVSSMLEKEDTNFFTEKIPEAHVRILKRKSAVPVTESKGDSKETQNVKDKDVAKQLGVIKPVRRPTRKSVVSGLLEKEENDLAAKKPDPEAQDDDLLSETRIQVLDQSSSITEALPHNGIVSEDKTSRDGDEINCGDKSIQIVNTSSVEVDLKTIKTPFCTSTTDIFMVDAEAPMLDSTAVGAETKPSDAEIVATVLSFCNGITALVTEPQFAGQNDSQGVSTDASESIPPISDCIQEGHSAEQSIRDDMGNCLSKDIKGNPLSLNPDSDGADADSILPALDASKGSSANRNGSSFGLHFLFAEERKDTSSRNDTNTVVEVDYGSKPSTSVISSFLTRSDCGVEYENVQPLGYDADKMLDVCQGVAQQEIIAAEKSNDEHVTVEFDMETNSNYEVVGLYMESNHILTEKNIGLVAESHNVEQVVIQVQQDAVQEGTLEKPSPCSAAPKRQHECSLPEEAGLYSIQNERCSPCAEESPLGVQSLCSQENLDDSMKHGAFTSAASHTESGVDLLKDCLVKCTVEKTIVSQSISQHDTHLVTEIDDCMCMSLQNKEIEVLPAVSHEGLVSSNLSGFSLDTNFRKEVICKGEGNSRFVHSEDLNASCGKSDANVSVDSDYGISGTVLSSSLHGPDTDNDDARLSSNQAQLESTDLLVELIGSSSIKVQHSSQKENYIEDKVNQVASGPCKNDIIQVSTTKCIESGVVLLPAEGNENLKDGQLNSKLRSGQAVGSVWNCNKNISNPSDGVSVVGIVTERNSPVFTLPKDYHVDHYLRRELLDNFSVEKSLEESAMSGGENVSNAGTVGNPSLDSAMSEHKGVLFEEVVHRMKNYIGTCPSSSKELVMELQSISSKEIIEESDQENNLALPISGFRGDESTIVETHVKVQSGSNQSLLESTDLMDESFQCSTRELLHQGHNNRCIAESTEKQVTSESCTYDIATTESATVKYIQSELDLLPVEETSELQDGQVNLMLESAKIVESSLSSNRDVRDILDNGSIGIVYEKFLFGDKSDSTVNTINNYIEPYLSNPRDLLVELQSPSNETIEDLDPHDTLVFPNTEMEADGSSIFRVENLADSVVPSEPAVYPGPGNDFSRDEGKQGCLSVSLHNDEGFLKSNNFKYTSAHLSEDARNIERDIIIEEVPCGINKKRESIRSSNCDILHENSHSKGYDRVEECHEVNEDKVAVLEKDMCEATPLERAESTIILDDEGEEYSFSCDTNVNTDKKFYSGSMKNSMFKLPEDCHLDSCQKQEVLNVLSVEEATDCQDQDESFFGPGTCYITGEKCNESSTAQLTSHVGAPNQDQYNENNEDQTTPGFHANDMSEASLTKGSGRVIDVVAAGSSAALSDEQLNSKPEGPKMEKHNLVTDKDTMTSLFDPEFVGRNNASNLPKNTILDPNFPNDLSAPRSPEKSMIFQDGNVSGSPGTCQSSRQRAIDEISTKLQSFRVSSIVKGSYIAMSASRPKQWDKLGQSAATTLHRNTENVWSVKVDHPVKPNPNRSAAKDSSRRAFQHLSGPRGQ